MAWLPSKFLSKIKIYMYICKRDHGFSESHFGARKSQDFKPGEVPSYILMTNTLSAVEVQSMLSGSSSVQSDFLLVYLSFIHSYKLED